MIPNPDESGPQVNAVKQPPYVSWALMALCVVAFLWQKQLPGEEAFGDSILHYGFTPSSLMSPQFDATGTPAVPVVLSIFTSMFIHGGWGHLIGNMLFLAVFGLAIEEAMGHVRFILFYLMCGVAAALTMAFMDPSSVRPMVGASGAVTGILGAYMLLLPRARVTLKFPIGLVFYSLKANPIWLVAIWFAMQLLSLTWPDASGIAWWAHVGGFAAGIALTPFFKSAGVPFFGPRSPRLP